MHTCASSVESIMAVTIKDIAKAAGVSHTTVSRALRGHPAIATKTVARIAQIADELGYVPNTVARGLKTKRSGILGVIVRRIDDPFFSEVLHGIEDVLHAQEYSLFLATSHRDSEREKTIVRAMSERRVDGVIICSTQVSEEHQRQLEHFGVPCVLLNNQASEHIAYSIFHDDIYGSHEVTQHLIDLGHKRIAYLGNEQAGRPNDDRLLGYQAAMREANLSIEADYITLGPNGRPAGGVTGTRRLLALAQRPSALVCYNDMMAIGAIQTLQVAGLQVPHDCSVSGFDDIELASYINPPLTTFHQPKYDLGREAATLMLHLLDGEATSQASNILTLRGQLFVRQSTAPPKS